MIEGLLWAAAPWLALKMLVTAAETPEQTLRAAGAVAMVAGVVIVWAVRG